MQQQPMDDEHFVAYQAVEHVVQSGIGMVMESEIEEMDRGILLE